MKKLKVALTLLLVFCCSLGLFACKNDPKEENKGPKGISEIEISGQKTNFNEGEKFSVGELKVTVYYQGDDNAYELTADDYEVDSSAYKETQAGQYTIYVVPKNQPEELWDGKPESKDNRVKKSYNVSVDHSWKESTDGKYQFACDCGAKRNSFTGLEDKVKTVAWNAQATFEKGPEGKTYSGAKAPITGENHVSYGSLVAGQSLALTLKINALTEGDDPTAVHQWDTPLMGFRNGTVGFIPREDSYVIGTAKGFIAAEGSNIPAGNGAAASGIATVDSPEWEIHVNGTNILAQNDFVNSEGQWSTVVVTYDYQADGILRINHDLYRFRDKPAAGAANAAPDATLTYTVKVPRAAYEVVVYGEFCDFTITDVEFVASLAITDYTVDSLPTNLVQPAGKMFDTTGLKATATFSDDSKLTENNFTAYAYRGEGEAKTRVNLSAEPLTADMYDFFVEFNGEEEPLPGIKVVATVVTGANSTAITSGNETFESPELTYDYAVTADGNGIRLTMSGAAVKATAEQAAVLGAEYTHFVAFKLVTNLAADAFDNVTVEGGENVKVIATKADTTVDVIVGLKEGFKAFTLKLSKSGEEETAVGSVLIDLSTLTQTLTTVAAEITESDFTLDAGGTYTVEYTGLTGVDDLYLVAGSAREKISVVDAKITDTYEAGHVPTSREGYYRVSNSLYIVGLDKTANSATVTYWLAAPDLGNLASEQTSTTVSLRNGTSEADTIISVRLTYNLAVSKAAINIGTDEAPVYVKVDGNKLQVFMIKETADIADGVQFAASLNIEHTPAEDGTYQMVYNVGVSITKGAAAWLDENELTTNTSTPKLIAFGTVNNPLDYDKGVVLVANLHLPAIGVRANSNTDKFRFTANEDTVNGQQTYNLYTVGGGTESDKIEKSTLNAGTQREPLQPGSCVKDGITAYKTEDGFYYGAIIVPATGAHNWQAKAGVENTEECTECHYTREKVTISDTQFEYIILGTETEYAQGNYEWWQGANGIIPNLSGDFAVQYTYTHADGTGNYSNARLQIFDEDAKYITIDLANPNDAVADVTSDGEAAQITKEFKIDGEPSTAYLVHEHGNGEFNGEVVALITRVGTVLTVTTSWTSTTQKKYECKVVISNAKAETVTVQIGGYGAAVQNVKSRQGEVVVCGSETIAESNFQIWGTAVPRYYTVNDGMKTTLRVEWNNSHNAEVFAGTVVNLINVNGKNFFLRPDAEGARSSDDPFSWRPQEITFDEGKSWGLGGENGYPLPDGVTNDQLNATKKDGAMEIEVALQNKVLSITFRFFDKSNLNTPLASWTCYIKDSVNEKSYQMELAIDDGYGDNGNENALTTKSITVSTDAL